MHAALQVAGSKLMLFDNTEKGMKFSMEPTEMGNVTIAVFDDTCENHVQIIQK